MNTNEGEEEQQIDTLEEEVETLEEDSAATKETADWKAERADLEGKLKRALKDLEQTKINRKVEKKVEATLQQKQGELDETALDYLDLKGVTEEEDLAIIERHVKRTGESVRQALKDDYVQSKLTANKLARDVKGATPSSTKRTNAGGGGNDLALAITKYEQSGYKELPSDFKLRSAVINAVTEKSDTNKPSWHK